MIEKKLYECEICHTSYADKNKAKECEKGHELLKDVEITGQYKPITMHPSGVPYQICVKFKSGNNVIYRL